MALHKILNKANNLEDINISLAKIEAYLKTEVSDNSYITRAPSKEGSNAVSIANGNFCWGKDEKKDEKKD
jgi:hypothetical protein